ncbi:MAG: hypothetical protein RPU60_08445, partial [Candidatus Sedimenticola sp. (ex Thyasira tokunagai)]
FPMTGRRVRMPTLLPLWRAARTTGKQCGLTATGDYQPSLRSPWLAADEGIASLLEKTPEHSFYVMEATGIYHSRLALKLYESGRCVSVVNPLVIK